MLENPQGFEPWTNRPYALGRGSVEKGMAKGQCNTATVSLSTRAALMTAGNTMATTELRSILGYLPGSVFPPATSRCLLLNACSSDGTHNSCSISIFGFNFQIFVSLTQGFV